MVGTLGVAGYLEAAEQIRKQAQAAGKKTYTLLMGKPSPVKLANFPEVDVFILIADAQVRQWTQPHAKDSKNSRFHTHSQQTQNRQKLSASRMRACSSLVALLCSKGHKIL